jgi:hypothetical protein
LLLYRVRVISIHFKGILGHVEVHRVVHRIFWHG